MASVGFVDPAVAMVDQLLSGEQAAFRDRWRKFVSDRPASTGADLLRDAAAAGLTCGGKSDLVEQALVAEVIAGRPALRALASGRYSLLVAMLGTPEQQDRALGDRAPVQALCLADRGVRVEPAEGRTIASGVIPAVRLAGEAALLHLVVFEGEARSCYLVAADAPGIAIEARGTDGTSDVRLTDLILSTADRLGGGGAELEYWLAVIGLLDGLEALAAGQRICSEAVAAAKARPVGIGTGFDDQDIQFRLAAVQARLIIASGYRASLFRRLKAKTIEPFGGAVAKLWLSQCAEEAARVAHLAGLVSERSGTATIADMLADAMRGNLLRDTIAAQI